ncbi:MAG: NAD(P)/FAD-dependent oxidoreductase [Acidobacteria bacterium]|nr:NAD(P)/FAD-dependent oxidoreductase [Acidobacteriota bacterium]
MNQPKPMIDSDVLIVGGGPAGSTCAKTLRERGLHVRVLDQARFPRDKVCAGWITPEVVETLGLDLDDYARARTLQPFRGFRTGAIDHREVATDYGAVVSYGIRRCEFDEYLLRRARVDVHESVRVEAIAREHGQWVVNGTFRAPVLVGAGGHFCPVSRVVNGGGPAPLPPEADRGLVFAQEVEFEMTGEQRRACPVVGELPALYFCPDRLGYGWVVRKGDVLNVGFGRVGERTLSRHVSAFQEFLARRALVPPDVPRRWHGHAYRLWEVPGRRCAGDGVVLVGDAAGLAYPVSGEGILPAVESGRFAAETILEARTKASPQDLSRYASRLRERFGVPKPASEASWGLPGPLVERVSVALLGSRWFARHVLLGRWFLHGRPLGHDRRHRAAA